MCVVAAPFDVVLMRCRVAVFVWCVCWYVLLRGVCVELLCFGVVCVV